MVCKYCWRYKMGIFSSFIQNGDNWYNRATFCLDAGNYQEAIAYYKRAVWNNPQDVNAWVYMGLAFYKIGNLIEAINCFNHTIALDPGCVHAIYNKATVLVELGELEEAIKLYDEALKLDPYFSKAKLNKNKALKLLNQEK